jgi:hypothetical protein
MSQQIIRFYRHQALDNRGRSLDMIRGFDDAMLESVHDYIQWLFPLRERSAFHPEAPTLTDAAVEAFHSDAALRAELAASLAVMLRFYGFCAIDDGVHIRIEKSPVFSAHARNWLTRKNHNFLRLTRIIRCLQVLGLPDEAAALFAELERIYEHHRHIIGADTFEFWRAAARAP